MAGFKWLQLLQEKCFPQKRNFVWSIMILLRLLRYFCGSQSEKKKRTETVLAWSVSEICFSHQQNVNVKGSTFLLTTPSLLSLVLEGKKPHEILFYSLVCERDYLMNWNLSQRLLFIVYNMNKNILWQTSDNKLM